MSTKVRYHFSSPRLNEYARGRKPSWSERIFAVLVVAMFGLIIGIALYGSIYGGY